MADTNKILGAVINDRYRAQKLIGKGGSGYVYEAVNIETDETVALKILKDVSAEDDDSVIRFEKEVAVSAKLSNPHTVKVHEFGKTREGFLVIAMEYLQGYPLTTLINDHSPLSPRRAVHLVRQILEALAEAHKMGIVHRDLKPDNIFILDESASGETDFVKVLDFGIAKFLHDDSVGDTLTRDGFVFGTPLYISPEQALGWAVTPASDVYSLGVILFELLTGETPFTAETPIGLGMKHIYEPPPLDRLKVEGGTGAAVKRLLALMLEKRPERRPASAAAALALFENLEEVADTPFDIAKVQVVQHMPGDDAPTIRAKPAREDDVEEYIEEQIALAEEVIGAPVESAGEPLLEEPIQETEDYTATVAQVVAQEAADEPEPGPEPKPEPVADPLPTPDPTPEEEDDSGGKKRKKKRRKKKRKAEQDPEAATEAKATPVAQPATPEPEVEPAPAPTLAPLVDPPPSHSPDQGAKTTSPRKPKNRRTGKAPAPTPDAGPTMLPNANPDEFSLFGSSPGFRTEPEEELPVDDWRLPRRRRSGSGVPLAAWLVLLLGLLVAAFVLYAVTQSGKSNHSPQRLIEVPATMEVAVPESLPLP